jgi:hypothetical protein
LDFFLASWWDSAHLDLDLVVDVFVGHFGGVLAVYARKMGSCLVKKGATEIAGSCVRNVRKVRVGGAMGEDLGFLNRITGLDD